MSTRPLIRTSGPWIAEVAVLAMCFSCGPAATSRRAAGAARHIEPSTRGPAALWHLRLRGGSDRDAMHGGGGADAALRKEAVTQIMAELFEQADAGNTTAMRLLGCSVSEGVGKAGKDAVLTFRCFLSSAQQGDVNAQYNLGVCYATGCGVRQDQVKATKWFRAAAAAGDTGAMRAIAIRMNEGRGCAADVQAATAAFLRAAEAGDPSAEFNLGVRYASGHGIPSPAPGPKAFYLGGKQAEGVEKEAEVTAAVDALDDLLADDRLDLSQTRIAAEWYKRATVGGHCKAMYNLAQLMATGKGVTLSQDGAIDLLRQAARKGYARAQYALFLQLNCQASDLCKLRADERAQAAAREAQEEGAQWLLAAAENNYGKVR
jgi:TPR repeat protein